MRRIPPSDVTIMFRALSDMKLRFTRLAFLLAFLAVASYAFVTLRGPRGIPGLMEKRRQIREMEKSNAEAAREIERLREHIKRLNDDPAAQELEIRERLKLVHPDEKVYITGEPAKK
jgi:cell division protein FtsB